jgi:hypothetical protein
MALLRPRPVTAVAHAVDPKQVERQPHSVSDWQTVAWDIWRQVGEIHYPTTQIARLVSRVEWVVEPKFGFDEMFGKLGAVECARILALNLQVAGECWLNYTEWDHKSERANEPHWEIVSVRSPKWKQRIENADIKIRVFNPDPTDEDKADSAVRAAIGPATELLTLEALSRSQSRSRIAQAGILLRPSTGGVAIVDDEGNEVDFNQLLTQAMTEPIIDENSTSALVPLDIEWDPETIEKWKHLVFERPYDEHIHDRMERCIRRIALALDIWPELLLGMADVNHWGQWFLAEDTWTGHAAPLAEQIAEAFTVAAAEFSGAELREVTADPAELLARRSTVADALDAAKLGAVGLRFIRDAIGAEDEDAPTDDDLETIAMLLGRNEPDEDEDEMAEQGTEDRPGPPATEDDRNRSDDAEPIAAAVGDPERIDPGAELGVALVRIDDQLRGWLDGASALTITLARSRVGMQARSRLRKDPASERIDGVDNADVVAVLGVEPVAELLDLEAVIRDSVEPIGERWLARLEDAATQVERLAAVDLSGVQYRSHREASVEVLVDDLTAWVLDTLGKRTRDLGVGPDLRRVLRVAGGG